MMLQSKIVNQGIRALENHNGVYEKGGHYFSPPLKNIGQHVFRGVIFGN